MNDWLADYDRRLAETEAKNRGDEMPLIATDSASGDFKLVPEGTHFAVCDMIANLGMQENTYNGESKIQHKVYMRWQIGAERVEIDGKDMPMIAGKTYTFSLHEKAALRKDLESWCGKKFTQDELQGFDITKLLGVPCQLAIVHNESAGRNYANINGVMAIPAGVDKPKIEGEPILFIDMNETPDAFDLLPKWIKEKLDIQSVQAGPDDSLDSIGGSDVPF